MSHNVLSWKQSIELFGRSDIDDRKTSMANWQDLQSIAESLSGKIKDPSRFQFLIL